MPELLAIVFLAPGPLLVVVYVATTILERRWKTRVVPALRDLLRQIRDMYGEPLFAIDGIGGALVVTPSWLHYLPSSGDMTSVDIASVVCLEITDKSRSTISFQCDLGGGRRTPEFATANVVTFASLFNVFVEHGTEIRYLT